MENKKEIITLKALKNMDAEQRTKFVENQKESLNRLRKEEDDLRKKIVDLQHFINTNILYCMMSFEEQELLDKQVRAIINYHNILAKRELNFKIYTLDEVIKYLKLGD